MAPYVKTLKYRLMSILMLALPILPIIITISLTADLTSPLLLPKCTLIIKEYDGREIISHTGNITAPFAIDLSYLTLHVRFRPSFISLQVNDKLDWYCLDKLILDLHDSESRVCKRVVIYLSHQNPSKTSGITSDGHSISLSLLNNLTLSAKPRQIGDIAFYQKCVNITVDGLTLLKSLRSRLAPSTKLIKVSFIGFDQSPILKLTIKRHVEAKFLIRGVNILNLTPICIKLDGKPYVFIQLYQDYALIKRLSKVNNAVAVLSCSYLPIRFEQKLSIIFLKY